MATRDSLNIGLWFGIIFSPLVFWFLYARSLKNKLRRHEETYQGALLRLNQNPGSYESRQKCVEAGREFYDFEEKMKMRDRDPLGSRYTMPGVIASQVIKSFAGTTTEEKIEHDIQIATNTH